MRSLTYYYESNGNSKWHFLLNTFYESHTAQGGVYISTSLQSNITIFQNRNGNPVLEENWLVQGNTISQRFVPSYMGAKLFFVCVTEHTFQL